MTIGFGLRNVTDKPRALASMRRVLRPGGQLLILEFSHPTAPGLKPLYDAYSFRVLPLLGQVGAGDADSYRYLAESIRMHPDQETLLTMMQRCGPRGLPLSQPERRHRRRAPRLSLLTFALGMLAVTLENLLNRSVARRRAHGRCAQRTCRQGRRRWPCAISRACTSASSRARPSQVTRGARRRRMRRFAPAPRPAVLLGTDAAQHAVRAVTVAIGGDAEIAEELPGAARAARPTSRRNLAPSSAMSPRTGSARRGAAWARWGRKAAATFVANVAEYLQEEGRDSCRAPRARSSCAGSMQLREDCDRLEARLERLAQRRGPTMPS